MQTMFSKFLSGCVLILVFASAASQAQTFLTATGNPCVVPAGAGACGGMDLSWRGDSIADPVFTHVQLWRDDAGQFRQMTCPDCCLPVGVNGGKSGFSVGASAKGFSLFYATGCADADADFRQLAGRVQLHRITAGSSAIFADDNPCLALDNTCESDLTWASDLQDPAFSFVELWRQDANQVRPMKCAALGTAGQLKTIGVGARAKTYRLYPVAMCDLTATTPPPVPPVAEVTVSRRQKVAGVSFIPYVLDGNGVRTKLFLSLYDQTLIRDQVRAELSDLRCEAGVTHIKVEMPAHQLVSWPHPTSEELDRFADFFADTHAEDLKVLWNLGTQCSVPNSALNPYRQQKIIGGHWRADSANSGEIFWDVTECTDDASDVAISWYGEILDGVRSRLASQGIAVKDVIDVVVVQGNYLSPLTPEMRLNDDRPDLAAPNPYLEETKAYLGAVMPALQAAHPDLLFGVQARFYSSFPPEEKFQFLANLKAAVSFRELDYVAYTSGPDLVLPDEEVTRDMLAVVGHANGRKMVLSDFVNGVFDNTTEYDLQVDNFENHLREAREYRLGGWWYWTLRDDPIFPDRWRGLRDATTTTPANAGWYSELLDLIETDVAAAPTCP